MEIEVWTEEYATQQLLKGDVSLKLLAEIGEYLRRDIIEVPRIIAEEYLSSGIGSDVIVVLDEGKIVATAIVFIDYKHIHTGCRTLVTDCMFGVSGNKVANIKLLKAMYAYAQMHECIYAQTTQYLGKKGVSLEYITKVRKLTRGEYD